ncbi:MAG: alpha/beta hydrolase [Kineosporiaceae bacterium]
MVRPTEIATLRSGTLEYRYERRGPGTVLICHGGHLRAEVPVGEDPLAAAGFSILVPSRPGYGRTPVFAEDPYEVAAAVRELSAELGLDRVAVLGISAGAPLAVALTARYPELVSSLVLHSPRSSLPWPDLVTRLSGSVAFHPWTQMFTWTAMQTSMALLPGHGLRTVMGSMSTLPAERVVADLTPPERVAVQQLFRSMRSDQGFRIDLDATPDPALEHAVGRPCLVVASPTDGAVPFKHAQHLARSIPGATLFPSPSLSHLIWFGTGARETGQHTVDFLSRTAAPSGA